MKRIGIDMDEVIADTLGEVIARYNRNYGTNHSKADLAGKRFWETIPIEHRKKMSEYFIDGTIFEDLPLFDHSPEVVLELTERYEVFITTAAMEVPSSFNAKFR